MMRELPNAGALFKLHAHALAVSAAGSRALLRQLAPTRNVLAAAGANDETITAATMLHKFRGVALIE